MPSIPSTTATTASTPLGISIVKQQAPHWEANVVENGQIKKITSKDLLGAYTILLFYPLDFTFVCPTELTAFNDRANEFAELGAKVYGVSVDSEYSHLAWAKQPRKEGGLAPFQLPLIADLNKQMSRAFGVLHDESVALRGLFIMDPSGVVRSATVNDLPIGRSVDETLRILKAVQFNDKHGEVCPANWTPGAKTIKADPEASKEYFSTL